MDIFDQIHENSDFGTKKFKKDDFFEETYNSKNVFNEYTKSIYYFNTNLNHLFVQEYAAGSSTYLSLYSSNDVSILLYDEGSLISYN